MATRSTSELRQSTRQKTAIIADRLLGADDTPHEAGNGVPAIVAVLTRRRTWVVGATALAALAWRAGRQHRRR
ncbi:hypothetical protein ABZ891_16865 [Streptomyces sp. NPDC047023]|uniref:hypothetical protein n=1 Tax=Streptomyces sp. NPDC047023 TaxID=3155139 RepID=UPI0033EE0E60